MPVICRRMNQLVATPSANTSGALTINYANAFGTNGTFPPPPHGPIGTPRNMRSESPSNRIAAKVERWQDREGGHPNLVIDYDGDRSHPVGRSLRREADQSEPCAHATIVLRWTPPNGYYVLTSYPECR